MTAHHANIHPIGRERSQPFEFKQLYGTHGSWQIHGLRLDKLESAEILQDSSTSTVRETSQSTSTASSSSSMGRAIVGGVALGGVGAMIGGATGKRLTETISNAVESKAIELTVKLVFIGGEVLHAIVTDVAAYHWLFEFTTMAPASAEDSASQSPQAMILKNEQSLDDRAKWFLPTPSPKRISEGWGTMGIGAVSAGAYIAFGQGSLFWLIVIVVIACVLGGLCLSIYNESAAKSNDETHAQNIADLIASFDRHGNLLPDAVEKIKNGTWRYESHR